MFFARRGFSMRIQCPNCHHGLEIVPDVSSTEVRCPSCGSQLDLSSSAETVTYRADSRRTIGHFELLEQVGRGHFGNVASPSLLLPS